MRRGTRLLLVTAFVLALAAPAQAWDRPVRLSDSVVSIPRIDSHGTLRVVQSSRRFRVEAGLLRWGERRFRRCGVRGIGRRAELLHSKWSINEAGAMLYAWNTREMGGRLRIAAAAPGRCFRRRAVLQRRFVPRYTRFFDLRLGPLGTVIAYWGPEDSASEFIAVGRLGSRLGRTQKLTLPRPGLAPKALTFLDGDRTLWTWGHQEPLPGAGERYREEVWASVGGARGARPRGGRRVAQVTGHDEDGYPDSHATVHGLPFITDSRGGQVAGGFSDDRFVLRTRRPGRAFGRAREIREASGATTAAYGGNRRGDAVFAWDFGDHGPIYALVRRRNGRLVGPTIVSKDSGASNNGRPSVGIDGAGRAVVAWVAQSGAISQLARSQIRVAVSDRRGRFGASKSATGPPDTVNQAPSVFVNARGQAALAFVRYRSRGDGNFDTRTLVTRRRLGG